MSADSITAEGQVTVFLSYARADRERIAALTKALQDSGLNVWWDALIEGGAAFAKTIETALEAADYIIVAWSAASVGSDWVRDEAAHGRDRGRFVPISLDGTAPPLGFRQYHFIDFTRWNGATDSPEVRQVLSALSGLDTAETNVRAAGAAAIGRSTTRRNVLVGASALVAASGGYWGWRHFGNDPQENSIAVLPFANLSGDPSQSYFSDGLSEELRARLGQTGQFKVAAQTSSNLFRDTKADAVTTAAKLGVAYLLDGSVRRAANVVRISTELIEAKSGLSKWSQTYDSKLTDIFSVQSEIAAMVVHAIAGQMATNKASATTQASGTSNIVAYDSFLKGREQYELDIDEMSDRRAIAYFDAAIAADANYAQAYAMRASALLDVGSNYSKAHEVHDIYAQALASARKAVALAPGLALAQLALGDALFTGQLNVRAARPAFDRAYALGQSNADILEIFAFFAAKTGRIADAMRAIDQAIALDPLNPLMFRAKGKIYFSARRYADAIPLLRQALAMNPKLSSTSGYIGHALTLQGKLPEARQAYLAEPREYLRLTGLAIVDDKRGDHGQAEASLSALITKFGDSELYQQAQIYAQRGDRDRAIAVLNNARRVSDSGLTQTLSDPLLAPLQNDGRFKSLLKAIGLN